jgi:hypothetical protein
MPLNVPVVKVSKVAVGAALRGLLVGAKLGTHDLDSGLICSEFDVDFALF